MSLDSIPTLPRALSVSGDDLIGIIDMADRRSPKSVTIADAVAAAGVAVDNESVNAAIEEDVSATHTALDASTTGGANKLPKFAADGTLTTGTLLPDATPGTYAHDGAGNIIVPDARGMVGKTSEGNFLWNMYYSDAHDSGGGELYVSGRNRICFNWGGSSGDGGFQLGTLGRSKEWVYMQTHGSGTVGDPARESKPLVWRGNHYNAGTPVNAWIGSQYVPTAGTTGYLQFNHITGDAPSDTNGRLLGTNVFNIANTGPVLPSGRTFTASGDFSITQNSVPVINSVATGAITNTIRVELGRVRIGDSGATGTIAVPFEVRNAQDASFSATAGSFYVDSSGTVMCGRLSGTIGGTSGRLIVQDRLGTASVDLFSANNISTFATTIVQTNVTDATSSAGAFRTSGGVSVAKGIYLGTVVTGTEQASEPAAPAANGFVIYAIDNGSGKTRLMVKFATGAAQQLAIEP